MVSSYHFSRACWVQLRVNGMGEVLPSAFGYVVVQLWNKPVPSDLMGHIPQMHFWRMQKLDVEWRKRVGKAMSGHDRADKLQFAMKVFCSLLSFWWQISVIIRNLSFSKWQNRTVKKTNIYCTLQTWKCERFEGCSAKSEGKKKKIICKCWGAKLGHRLLRAKGKSS